MKWLSYIISIICFVWIGQYSNLASVQASSCSVKLSSEETEVKENEEILVTLTISATQPISGVELLLSYEEEKLEFLTGSPMITGEDGTLKLFDTDIETPKTTNKYLIKFRGKSQGISYIKINKNAVIYNNGDGQPMSYASNELAIQVKSNVTLSSNANLKELRISSGKLNPVFSTDVLEYNVTVEQKEKKMIVSAIPEDENATVTIKGEEKLQEGENIITVLVKAQNGDTKKYRVVATRKSKDQEKKDTTEKEEKTEAEKEERTLGSHVTIEKEDKQTVLVAQTRIEVIPKPEEVELFEGYVESVILVGNDTIPVYKEAIKESDLVLVYGKSGDMTEGFYEFNRTTQTITPYQKKESEEETTNIPLSTYEETKDTKYQQKYKTLQIVTVSFAVLILLLLVLIIKLFQKRKGFDEMK